jgi:hypothetical protein
MRASVPRIHVAFVTPQLKDVHGRHKAGHDADEFVVRCEINAARWRGLTALHKTSLQLRGARFNRAPQDFLAVAWRAV